MQLAQAFAKGAKAAGHQVNWVSLVDLEVKGCLGCNACRYGKPCVIKDDFPQVRQLIEEADLIVFASPLYFWTISSRLKALIQRFYSMAQQDNQPPLGRYERYPQKEAILLMTAADNFFWTFQQSVSYYQFSIIQYIGFQDKGMILAGGCGNTNGKPAIQNTPHPLQAYELGKGGCSPQR